MHTRTLSGFLLLALWSGLAAAAEPIRIAVAGPYTGPVAQYGEMQKIGALMAAERINAAGGVLGRQLEVVLTDDACEPKQAVAVANQNVNAGIRFVVGHLCSGSTQPAARIYEDEGVLMITPASTNPAISQLGYRMTFRTIGTDDQQGPAAGRHIVERAQPKRLAIIHDKQTYGQGVASEVRKTVEAAGLKVALFEGVSKGQTDFSALVTKLKAAGVDFVYYGGYHPELGLLLRQSREQGYTAQFMGPEGVGNKDLSAIAGQASEGLLVTLPADFSTDPANAALVKAFRDRHQDPTGPFVLTSYAAVQVIADGIRAAGAADAGKVAAAIRARSFDTPMGRIGFRDNGDLKDFRFVVFTWHADGSKTPVK